MGRVETVELINLINDHLEAVDFNVITTVQAKKCRDFNTLMDIYRKNMTITQSIEDCAAICMAVHIATKLDGDPLWFYLVGAPSSGKSTLCELICADEQNTRPLSKFTGLVSGSTQGKNLIPMLHNKCVVVKDGTLLLESTPIQLANVYGELRDIYDGSLEAHYRNGVSASYTNISFGMLIGITERVYALNMSALGERFLHCRLESDRDTELVRNQSAIRSVLTGTKRTMAEGEDTGDSRSFPLQREYTAGFLSHLHTRVRNEHILQPEFTTTDEVLIQAIADVVACSRAQTHKDFKDNILFDSRPETSTRLCKQIARLALCLCYVLGVKKITPKVRELLTKVCLDSSYGRQYHTIRSVALSRMGMSRNGVALDIGIPLTTIAPTLEDLVSLKILAEDDGTNDRSVGRRTKILTCAKWVEHAFRTVEQHGTNLQKCSDTEDEEVPQVVSRPKKKRWTKKKKRIVKR
jgi:hypothetical protein